ncbi:hypothetical protein TorRG33x02_271860, partial [Trema orientale]
TCTCVAPATWPLHSSSTPLPSGRATSQYVAPTVKPTDHVCRPCLRLCARAPLTMSATSQVRAFLTPIPHVAWDSVVGIPYRPRLSVMAESMAPRTPHFSATSRGAALCPTLSQPPYRRAPARHQRAQATSHVSVSCSVFLGPVSEYRLPRHCVPRPCMSTTCMRLAPSACSRVCAHAPARGARVPSLHAAPRARARHPRA